jgi:hypothetical protein
MVGTRRGYMVRRCGISPLWYSVLRFEAQKNDFHLKHNKYLEIRNKNVADFLHFFHNIP